MKRKATVSKKRRTTTYIPQRGKGWVAISSTDSDISLDFDFTGINSNINSEEQIDELDKDCQEYQDYDINPELLDESNTFIENNQDKIPQDHSNFKTDNSKYDYRRAKYLAEKKYEKNYWTNRRENLADWYVSSIHDGQRISSCNSTKLGLFKCIKCNLQYCSIACFYESHQDHERMLHPLKEWDDDYGWSHMENQLKISCCDCSNENEFEFEDIFAINIYGVQRYIFKGCDQHILKLLIAGGYFTGSSSIAQNRIIFDIRYIFVLSSLIYFLIF